MAAHLHDSVLQTLALIQRSAGDPATVARLARAQERDLRSWLFDDTGEDPRRWRAALRAVAAEVEDAHGVHVEVVCVGDAPVTEEDRPLVLAAREAMTNAAKHSGAGTVDVYAEATAAGRRRVRARPGRRLRPDPGRRGPAGRPRQHRRADGASRRHRLGAQRSRRRHRGPPVDAHPRPATKETRHDSQRRHRRRPRHVPHRRTVRARHRPSTSSPRRPTSTRPCRR